MKRTFFCLLLPAVLLLAREPLASRIAHNDPTKYRHAPAVHDGAGSMDYLAMFNSPDFNTNLFFLHRGIINPKSGIGVHFHNQCEEMFVVLEGEAQFTIDGRTSTLKAPAGALCRAGHSHAIYNATDKPLQWMNINVSNTKGKYDAFNLGDPRVGVPLDPIPTFIHMLLDKTLLKPANGVQYRRALPPDVFNTNWSYVDHVNVPLNVARRSKPDFASIEPALTVFDGTSRSADAATNADGRARRRGAAPVPLPSYRSMIVCSAPSVVVTAQPALAPAAHSVAPI